jgi:hypothetical protein
VTSAELAVDFELLELRVARERQMLDRLVRFADTKGCRRQNLLRYFGDADAPRGCKACESCVGSRAPEPEEVAPQQRKARAAPPVEAEGPFDANVFERLRALRTELAREGQVPPYVIFHDRTLRELARALPHDERTFLAVKGAGPGRWQRYGARVIAITGAASAKGERLPTARVAPEQGLPVVREEVQTPARPPAWLDQVPPPAEDAAAPREAQQAGDELWSLCASGATLGEICARLRRTSAEVASQLADGARQGREMNVARLLGPERVDAIRTAAQGTGGDMVAVRKRLPFPAALAEIRLALFVPA